jgi:hypothetical protein
MSAIDSTASAMSAWERPKMPAVNLHAVKTILTAMPRKMALKLRCNRFGGTPH